MTSSWVCSGTAATASIGNYNNWNSATCDDTAYSGYRIWTNDSTNTVFTDVIRYTVVDHQIGDKWYKIPKFQEQSGWTDLGTGENLKPIYVEFKPQTPEELAAAEAQLKKQQEEMQKRLEEQRKQMLKAQETARDLLETLVPEDKVIQLKKERRIELIARNGKVYEILDDGRVNRLLEDGKKQGLCINMVEGPYPADDIIIAKLLLLENDPDKFEEIANKVSPFQLATVPA